MRGLIYLFPRWLNTEFVYNIESFSPDIHTLLDRNNLVSIDLWTALKSRVEAANMSFKKFIVNVNKAWWKNSVIINEAREMVKDLLWEELKLYSKYCNSWMKDNELLNRSDRISQVIELLWEQDIEAVFKNTHWFDYIWDLDFTNAEDIKSYLHKILDPNLIQLSNNEYLNSSGYEKSKASLIEDVSKLLSDLSARFDPYMFIKKVKQDIKYAWYLEYRIQADNWWKVITVKVSPNFIRSSSIDSIIEWKSITEALNIAIIQGIRKKDPGIIILEG